MNSDFFKEEDRKGMLIRYFQQYIDVPSKMKTYILEDCSTKTFNKHKFLVSPLDLFPNVYFILKGTVRGFVRNNGEEVTTWISLEKNIVGLTLYPSSTGCEKTQYIQALEETEVIIITYALIEKLLSLFPEMSVLTRKLLWVQYQEAEERNFIIRLSSAPKRIKRLKDTNPDFFTRIPLKYLASFLGMRIETLSRLRSKS
ncbi:Crp/Fnr family transcriptional regulator [Pedobacter chinensis]|uniref:Crp/Fnr family transcriptional regulator n=1 Tax=Pedobacter chinensis TaxID=2282421 RepID=A0A369Q0S3_9SPHI|nr:Crp/Fnr family transcriptional regulator [Pedobacter chinensis]RDC55938.1 Crp/Fnr family transcriptional regulator [Pedobacter chinensis]